MKALARIKGWLLTQLTEHSYNSDYRRSLTIIQRMAERYAPKIDGSDPGRYLWRAICQYRCQASARKTWVVWFANALAIAALPGVVLLVRRARPSPSKTNCYYLKIDFHAAYKIPDRIRGDTVEARPVESYLHLEDLRFAFALFLRNGVFYPELLLKFIFWLASVRPHLNHYHFEYLLQYGEYSAHSSLRKLFVNSLGAKVANVTHGEEHISCRSAFSSFDQYFAWDLTPRSIHDAMHIEYGERFAFNPCAGIPRAPATGLESALGFLWPSLEGSDLKLFVDQLNQLGERYHIIVRPHPNSKYANHFAAYRGLLLAEISDPHTETIHSFIDRSGLVVGYLSAVLVQAMFRGRKVLYLKNAYLTSLSEYHDYYREVPAVPLEQLSGYLTGPSSPMRPG